MERCPNCGAPARPNANFCTTCGVRLPDDLTPAQPSPSTAAPSEPAADNGWPPVEAQGAVTPPLDDAANDAAGDASAGNGDDVQPEIVVAAESEALGVVEANAEPNATTWPSSGAWPQWSAPEAAAPEPEEAAEAEAEGQESPDAAAAVPELTAPSSVDQALALLDQVRALLPTAMTPVTAPSSPSDPAVADALADALAVGADDIDALRDAME
ncbi:MAG TPA: zinc ribbon domain-containing protein, partial [Thermomicrobiales bacterium]|nr:zinc ribbon domain-containing protein [Thermomicrobiales bacterium]